MFVDGSCVTKHLFDLAIITGEYDHFAYNSVSGIRAGILKSLWGLGTEEE
jgi:hypothetical protein